MCPTCIRRDEEKKGTFVYVDMYSSPCTIRDTYALAPRSFFASLAPTYLYDDGKFCLDAVLDES